MKQWLLYFTFRVDCFYWVRRLPILSGFISCVVYRFVLVCNIILSPFIMKQGLNSFNLRSTRMRRMLSILHLCGYSNGVMLLTGLTSWFCYIVFYFHVCNMKSAIHSLNTLLYAFSQNDSISITFRHNRFFIISYFFELLIEWLPDTQSLYCVMFTHLKYCCGISM